MSIRDHLPIRLWWAGGKGLAISNGAMMTLRCPPHIGFEYAEIDYAPGACALVRRAAFDRLDDMTPDEIAACMLYLAELAADPPDLAPDC